MIIKINKNQKGAASLPIILSLIILILALGIGITSLALTETFISAGQSQSSQAFVYAEAGARDALMRIARNKNYNCPSADCYSLDFVSDGCSSAEGCAKIAVSNASGTQANPKIIVSKGQSKASVRQIQVSVIFDASLNGEIATTTWSEITQ